jgi:hypothetical protein
MATPLATTVQFNSIFTMCPGCRRHWLPLMVAAMPPGKQQTRCDRVSGRLWELTKINRLLPGILHPSRTFLCAVETFAISKKERTNIEPNYETFSTRAHRPPRHLQNREPNDPKENQKEAEKELRPPPFFTLTGRKKIIM